MSRIVCVPVSVALIFFTQIGLAHAQSSRETPRTRASDRDQTVTFDDDLLDADLATPFGDPVFARHLRSNHALLIRPRTSFVPELLESIEQI